LQTLLVGIFTGPWWIWAAYMVSLFPMGKFALAWYGAWKKTMKGGFYWLRLTYQSTEAWRLVEQRSLIIQETWKLIG
jgi:hypothetical protein